MNPEYKGQKDFASELYDIERFFELSLDMLCIAGVDGYFKRVNPAFRRVLNLSDEKLLNTPFVDFIHPEDVKATLDEVERLKTGIPTLAFENRYRCSSGEYKNFLWTTCPDKDTGLLYAVARDITERRRIENKLKAQAQKLEEANRQLTELATTDSLTLLKNRRAFQDGFALQVRLALRMHRPVSILMLDIDRFKEYNDAYGHTDVDLVLKNIAGILLKEGRGADLIARWGGEEFVLVLPQAGREGALSAAERLREAIEEFSWPLCPVTASFGVNTFDPAFNLERDPVVLERWLVEGADCALYCSKGRGRNCVTHVEDFKETLK